MAGRSLTEKQIEALLERASHKGAQRALADIGLQDNDAVHDIKDLRNLIDGYRELKRTVASTVLKWFIVAFLGFVSLAVWTQIKD
jgi:hypothetical protein